MANTNIRLSLALDACSSEIPLSGALIVNAKNDADYSKLGQATCIQWFKPTCDRLMEIGLKSLQNFTTINSFALVEITRSKPQSLGLIAKAFDALSENSILMIDGNKTDGIESHLKTLRKLFKIEGIISKSHGKIFWIKKATRPQILDQWVQGLEPVKIEKDYKTKAGIFSANHIDKASSLLLKCLPKHLGGIGADLGAGWGYLSNELLKTNDKIKSICLVEADWNALHCAKLNINDSRAKFEWTDATQHKNVKYDFIIMNPPFHQTRKAEPDIGKSFIIQASELLTPKGQLWMVANRQLAYETTLDTCFTSVNSITETPQFKVINALRPKKQIFR
ncbi:methyltransferase, putative [Rhodobacterales bacterium HTCC2255]|nr:methyltransferase, putative [Rhodobacterales bacterium HTCC2255]